jgi:hypothetical protein
MAFQKTEGIPAVAQNRLKILLARLPELSIAPNKDQIITFTGFPKLPIELRQKIWRHAACHERIIKLNYKFGSNHDWKFGVEDNKVEGQSKAPAVLAVCSESRKEALRCYTLVPVTHVRILQSYRSASQCHILMLLLALPENSKIHV